MILHYNWFKKRLKFSHNEHVYLMCIKSSNFTSYMYIYVVCTHILVFNIYMFIVFKYL